MQDPVILATAASAGIFGLAIASTAGLKAWHDWLDVKRLELAQATGRSRPSPVARIEMADLKERVRKLEAIANGVEQ